MARTKALRILLRVFGISALFALVAVMMPMSWMARTHAWLGLGQMPEGPIVEYLARSLSAFYAMFGALALVLATDLRRYRPLVRWLAALNILMGLALLGIDLSAGMPASWTWSEGPMSIVFGGLIFVLARPED